MRRTAFIAVSLALVLAAMAAGCGQSTAQPSTDASTAQPSTDASTTPAGKGESARPRVAAGELWGRWFRAVSFEREGRTPAVVPVRHTRFSFSRERFAGKLRETIGWDDGCNGFGGFIHVRGHTMRVWNVAGTAKACIAVGPDGKAHSTEGGPILMNFFSGTLRWRLHGTHLAISAGGKALRLREVTR